MCAGVRVYSNTLVADINIVIARGEIGTGENAQGDVATAAFVVLESVATDRRVTAAGGVAQERTITGGRIETASFIELERTGANSRVRVPLQQGAAADIAPER